MGKTALSRTLTPQMRGVLIASGIVVAAGLATAVWLMTAPAGAPVAVATPLQTTAPPPGPVAGAPATTGSEVQTPDPARSPMNRLPDLPTPSPRIAEPLPPSGTAQGGLVDGFPRDLAAPTDGSDVLDSSLASDGGTLQFSLTARTDATPDQVQDHYRTVWGGLGLSSAGDANGATTFLDPFSSVTVTVDAAAGTGTVYRIYGVLRAG